VSPVRAGAGGTRPNPDDPPRRVTTRIGDAVLENIFNGLSLASILLLAALGLTFTFGQMGVINMAHGEFIMAGAYMPYVLQTGLLAGATGLAFGLSIPLAFVVGGLLGFVLERTLLSRMHDRPLDTLLLTVGVSLILQQLVKDLFGAANVQVVTPDILAGNFQLLGVTMPRSRLFIMMLCVATMVGVQAFLSYSPMGRRMRAVTQNLDLAAVSGLRTKRTDAMTFFLGSGLAGIAGVAVALIGPIGSQTGTAYIVDTFLVVIMGGLGKLRGAIIAALAIGMLSSFSVYYTTANLGKAIVFVGVIIFLQFRPNGIVSFRTRGLTA
jgi:urea transport system permease protein